MKDDKQIGCEFNKLDLFEKSFDGTYYTLNGLCITCRNVYWKHANDANKKDRLIEESPLSYTLFMPVLLNLSNLEFFKGLIEKIESLSVQPTSVVFVKGVYDKLDPSVLTTDIAKYISTLDKKYNLHILQSYDKIMERAIINYKNSYYMICGYTFDNNIISNYLEQINHDLLFNQIAPKFINTPEFKFLSHPHFMEHGIEYNVESYSNNSES